MNRVFPQQLKVLRIFAEREASGEAPPTIREIAEEMGISSTNGVADHLKALERKGLLRCSSVRQARSRHVTPAGRRALGVVATPILTPWFDCKVSFLTVHNAALSNFNFVREICQALLTPHWKGQLPSNWMFVDADGTSGRWALVFSVAGIPTTKDGVTVANILREIQAQARET